MVRGQKQQADRREGHSSEATAHTQSTFTPASPLDIPSPPTPSLSLLEELPNLPLR